MKTFFYLFSFLLMIAGGCSSSEKTELDEWLKTPFKKRTNISELECANTPLSKEEAIEAQNKLLVDIAQIVSTKLKQEWEDKTFTSGEFKMPFKYEIFKSEKQKDRCLFISMHGGGGAPAEVNDQQWSNQCRLYKPKEGVYLSPRSPTDTWNMWHQSHIDAFFDKIIQSAILFENVDPNKVYVLGYSAGGDGAYQIAPRMADRWAAAAMMAGHPGDASPLNLRNLPFDLWVGELDSAYNRHNLVPVWEQKLQELQDKDSKGYIHRATVVKGKGHWMDRADTASISWMMQYTRNPYPAKVVWKQDDVLQSQLYWVEMPKNQQTKESKIVVSINNNIIQVHEASITEVSFYLNDEMLDLDEAVQIIYNNKTIYNGIVPRTIASIYQSMANRYDPAKIFTAKITVKL